MVQFLLGQQARMTPVVQNMHSNGTDDDDIAK